MGVREATLTQAEYERIALSDEPEIKWELHDGTLREKPGMTAKHNLEADTLVVLLGRQLDLDAFTVNGGRARLHSPSGDNYIPDVCVIPMSAVDRHIRERGEALEVHDTPVPLVVEVWSPSTGRYDVDTKFPEYKRRGDLELWRVHPIERTVMVWVRQPDGSYIETFHTSGIIHLNALPGVSIRLTDLFRR